MARPSNPKELAKFRIKINQDAQKFRKPERVPFILPLMTWQSYDAGFKPMDVARNYDWNRSVMIRFAEKYPLDGYGICGFRFPVHCSDACGGQTVTNDDNMSAIDIEYMSGNDYAELKANEHKMIYEKMFLEKFPIVKTWGPEQFAAAAKTYITHRNERAAVNQLLEDVYGVPQMHLIAGASSYIETIFAQYRGIKGTALDMRRHYEELKDVCQSRDIPLNKKMAEIVLASPDGPADNTYYDASAGYLAHTICNHKQFEDLFWTAQKPVYDACQEKGKIMHLTMEGSFDHVGEFFTDYKKGVICSEIEQDDPFMIRQKYPNIAIYGGLDVNVTGYGTAQECVDMAKKAIDELGTDGGLVLSTNKFLNFKNDMKSENLTALIDFVNSYK